MLQDCQHKHSPSFKTPCCLTHLLLMEEYSKDHLIISKYRKYFSKEITQAYKNNKLQYSKYDINSTNHLMQILIKLISHYYFKQKFKISKAIINICIDTSQNSLFKLHPLIIYNKSIVYNNVACIYERTKKYDKALKYLNYYNKYISSNIDKLIYLNNVIKIFLKQNKIENVDNVIEEYKKRLLNEMNIIKKEKQTHFDTCEQCSKGISSPRCKSDPSFEDKCKLISFLLYNYSFLLEKLNKNNEANSFYLSGYEFSIAMLGEHSLYSMKYINKININTKDVKKNKTKDLFEDDIKLTEEDEDDIEIKQVNDDNKQIDIDNISNSSNNDNSIISTDTNHKGKEQMNIQNKKEENKHMINIKMYLKNKINEYINQLSLLNDENKIGENNIHVSNFITGFQNDSKALLNSYIKEFNQEHEMKLKQKQLKQQQKKQEQELKQEQQQQQKQEQDIKQEQQTKQQQSSNLTEEEKKKEGRLRLKNLFSKVVGSLRPSSPPKGKFAQMIQEAFDLKNNTNTSNNVNQQQQPEQNDDIMFGTDNENENNVIDICDIEETKKKTIEVDKIVYPYHNSLKTKFCTQPQYDYNIHHFEQFLNESKINLDNCQTEFTFTRVFKEIQFLISLSITNTKFIYTLQNQTTNTEYHTLNLEFKKIKATLPKMQLHLAKTPTFPFKSYYTISHFAKLFSEFISIIQNGNNNQLQYKFGISPTPIGLITDKRIEIKINKNTFLINIIKINANYYKAYLSTSNGMCYYVITLYTNRISCNISIENELLTMSQRFQEIMRTYTIDLKHNNNSNIVYTYYLNLGVFIFNEIISDSLITLTIYVNNDNNIKTEYNISINDKILYEYFGINIKTLLTLASIEDKQIILNLLCLFVDKDNITNGVTLKPLSILYENIDEVDNKIYYIQVININEVVYSVVKLCDKTKNEEIVRVLIIEDNSIFDLKGNNLKEYFNKNNLEINKKIIEYAKSVYFNENVFSLIDSFSRIISLY